MQNKKPPEGKEKAKDRRSPNVSSDRIASEELDSAPRTNREFDDEDIAKRALPYDFRRPDRIAKDQLRAIHLLHENFARTLASSLSAYLRAYVAVNLISVEQLSFMEFSQCLPAQSCLVALGMRPSDGNAVLEVNPTLVFPILEMLLGGTGKSTTKFSREITEIEQSILESFFRIVLHDLKNAWQTVTPMEFNIESHETDPQLMQILAPNEAVVAVSLEVRIGENSGMMNIGIPSIVVKMLRNKFDQQWSLRKSESTETEQTRILRLIKPAEISLDTRLDGPTLRVEDLLDIEEGDVLTFDYPVERPLLMTVNGRRKFRGGVVDTGRKRAFEVIDFYTEVD